MEQLRKPFQGVGNIIRFNRHFYLLTVTLILLIQLINLATPASYGFFGNIICLFITGVTLLSLMVSFYVYDLSTLYKFTWLKDLTIEANRVIININAGFDETSVLIKNKFPDAELIVYDFYDPLKHTEVSIKRARKAYPSFPGTKQVLTSYLPLPDYYAQQIFVFLAAHEIRNEGERTIFFNELKRILTSSGQIVVTEHLRDIPNFLAYNIGFLHFISKASWHKTFEKADLQVSKEIKITPFITTFILRKNGVTP